MYRELLSNIIANHNRAELQDPCAEKELTAAEEYVGFPFPAELKALLRETNGDHWLLLSAAQIIEHTKSNREIFPKYLASDEFEEKVNRHIFFATNGCGDYYCYRVLPNGTVDTSGIYIWEHELFETRWVAEDISDMITKYYNDEI